MDPTISAAARALASGDALSALNSIALRDDAHALALRGIAMAQLGDLERSRLLLRRAMRAFPPAQEVERARCVTAEAEVALASRDLGWSLGPLERARAILESQGDIANAAHARYLTARFMLLIGRLDEAERIIRRVDPSVLPPASRAAHELVAVGIAMRRLKTGAARSALAAAAEHATRSGITALAAEVESAARTLEEPVGRLFERGTDKTVRLMEVEALLASRLLVVDACRRVVSRAGEEVSLKTRPVLFALARALAEASPGDASRTVLLARAFRAKDADDSHRARLRVEIGRLRRALADLARIEATRDGFVMRPKRDGGVVVLAPAQEDAHGTVLALLADGKAWSSSALSLALGSSQRTVQRALEELLASGKAQAIGQGRTRRWMAPPVPGFPTTLLLSPALAGG